MILSKYSLDGNDDHVKALDELNQIQIVPFEPAEHITTAMVFKKFSQSKE
jgi:hypothetical protein